MTCFVFRGMMHDLTAAVSISDFFLGFCAVMPWLEWCPDPQQPDAQWVKVVHPGSWTLQGHPVEPPPRHTYREWKLCPKQVYSSDGVPSTVQSWYTRDWATERYRPMLNPNPGPAAVKDLATHHPKLRRLPMRNLSKAHSFQPS